MSKQVALKWLWFGAGFVSVAALVRWQLARLFTEKPNYELERRSGDVEIRGYAAGWVAETTVDEARWDVALNEGFRRLAGHIFGDNRPSPFQPDRLGRLGARGSADTTETLAMTVPVNVTPASRSSHIIALNLPPGRTLASLPAPNDERVRLESRPERRVAVLRYRGRHTDNRVAQKFSELIATLRSAGLQCRGMPQFAAYDPPSTLPLFRRNEVWVELAPA